MTVKAQLEYVAQHNQLTYDGLISLLVGGDEDAAAVLSALFNDSKTPKLSAAKVKAVNAVLDEIGITYNKGGSTIDPLTFFNVVKANITIPTYRANEDLLRTLRALK